MRELHEHPGPLPSVRSIWVFIFYAQANRDMVELLLNHLGGLANDQRVEIFDDCQLVVGEDWDARLKEASVKADLVLFVVTAKFLRSAYCARVGLKETIRRREADGITVSRSSPSIASGPRCRSHASRRCRRTTISSSSRSTSGAGIATSP